MSSIKIPQNQIKYKYTIGKELMYVNTYKEYQGHYYELNNNFFVGKEFNINAPVLMPIKSDRVNPLLENPITFVYGNITKSFTSNLLINNNKELKSIPINSKEEGFKYFAKKLNTSPIKIIAISEEDYLNNINTNKLYSFTEVFYDIELGFEISEENTQKIPEIDIFLENFSLFSEEE
jgi:hypothetical protein